MLNSSYNELVLASVRSEEPNSSGWIRVSCPICSESKPDKKRSLAFNVDSGYWCCNRCGERGFVHPTVGNQKEPRGKPNKQSSRLPSGKLLRVLPPSPGLGLPNTPLLNPTLVRVYLAAYGYLRYRSVPDSVIQQVPIYLGLSDNLSGKLVFPIFRKGLYKGFVAKEFLKPGGYINSSSFDRTAFFNGDALDQPGVVFIVEGIFDALPYWPKAVATFGKPTRKQIRSLASARASLILALDADAYKDAKAVRTELRRLGKLDVDIVRLSNNLDPNDYAKKAVGHV